MWNIERHFCQTWTLLKAEPANSDHLNKETELINIAEVTNARQLH